MKNTFDFVKKILFIFRDEEKRATHVVDIVLFWLISLSVLTVVLESINSLHLQYQLLFLTLEWFFTIIFSIEYVLRVISVKRLRNYVFSFMGVVDLVALYPHI